MSKNNAENIWDIGVITAFIFGLVGFILLGIQAEYKLYDSIIGWFGIIFIIFAFILGIFCGILQKAPSYQISKISKHPEQKLFDHYIEQESNRIIRKDNISDTRDREAVRQLVKIRANSVDVIQDIQNVSKEKAEEIFEKFEIKEEKRVANHTTFEGRISISDKNKLKSILGTKCMACGKDLSEIYGNIGTNYIELHHKIPYSDIKENETRVLNKDDFCVLCPDCHRMIHKLPNAEDIDLLTRIINLNKKS
ncbi:MAG: HNH endonuclease [Alphaproteobacteria bacterium]|nr:HNH endonuclease [Alphaproteobacteria bacterium]